MRWFKPEAMNELYFNPVLGKARDWKYLANEGVKVYMMVGTKELFADEVYAVGKAMKEAAGAEVQVRGVSSRAVSVLNFRLGFDETC